MQQSSLYPWFDSTAVALNEANQRHRLPHGLLLAGPTESGKFSFAARLASSLLCQNSKALLEVCGDCKSCHLIDAESHPDYYLIQRLVDNKGKQKKTIGIDQIRQLNARLTDTAQLGGWRVAVIGSVLDMTTAAFNALLKTLEEPGDRTLLILLSDNLARVPATVRSRCQIIKPHFDLSVVKNWLIEQTGKSSIEVDEAMESCYGAPLAAKSYLGNNEPSLRAETFQQLDAILTNRITPATFLSSNAVDEISLASLLCDYFHHISKQMMSSPQGQYQQAKQKLVFLLYSKVAEYNRAQHSGSNLQPKLQIEAILIQWFEFGRKINRNSRS